jgi:hypothetical protein
MKTKTKPKPATQHHITSLDTQHLNRLNGLELDDLLDTVLSAADWELSTALNPKVARKYNIYSLILLYHDYEEDMREYAGFQANYIQQEQQLSIHQYELATYICHTGADRKLSEQARCDAKLRRYRLFNRVSFLPHGMYSNYNTHNSHWYYSHAGQMPFYIQQPAPLLILTLGVQP